MRHFYLIKNPEKAGAARVAGEICRYIESRGGTCMVWEKDGQEERGTCQGHSHFQYTDAHRVPLDTECVITLGGDGTLIQAARDLAGSGLPIIPS